MYGTACEAVPSPPPPFPTTPAPILVEGAGTSEVNGLYAYRGVYDSRGAWCKGVDLNGGDYPDAAGVTPCGWPNGCGLVKWLSSNVNNHGWGLGCSGHHKYQDTTCDADEQDEALINQHPTTSQNGTNNNAGSSSNGVAGPSNEPRRNRGISNFFSSGFQNEAVGEAVSPVMALKAKQDRMERKKPKGKQRTGGLRRLLPSVETTLTPDQEVNDYLKRAGIEVGSPDAREDSHAAVELHRHQVEVSLERRAAQAHRSRVQHARHNLIRWFGSQKEDSEPLGERRSQFDSEASVRSGKSTILDRVKRATTRRLTTVSVKSMVSPSARASVRPRSESSLNTARL